MTTEKAHKKSGKVPSSPPSLFATIDNAQNHCAQSALGCSTRAAHICPTGDGGTLHSRPHSQQRAQTSTICFYYNAARAY
ncbi:unnamed protein product [Leptosia nina]|uniref:Uncharacterized protein n=1 Tax=Leptosia nina TaxID=320188 RepID=A0AAV1JZR0_9NEOP